MLSQYKMLAFVFPIDLTSRVLLYNNSASQQNGGAMFPFPDERFKTQCDLKSLKFILILPVQTRSCLMLLLVSLTI